MTGMADSPIRALPTSARTVVPAPIGTMTHKRFGGMTPPQLQSILIQTDQGLNLQDWADFVEWVCEDDRISSVLDTRIDAACNLAFECRPGRARPGQEALAQLAAEKCQEMLESTTRVTQVFDDMFGALPVGYSAAEHQWRRENGWWLSTPVGIRPRDIAFNADWSFRFRTFDNGFGNEWINAADHPGKFMTFAFKRRGSTPLRSGAVRQVAMLWLFKRWAWRAWMNGAERMGTPMAIGKVQRDAAENARSALLEALKNMSEGQSAVIEDLTDLVFPQTGFNVSADIFEKLIDRVDKAITVAVLGSMDAVDGGANGSMARAEVQERATIDPRNSKLVYMLYEVIERDWLAPFLDFNREHFGGVVPPTPIIVLRDDESEINTDRFTAFSAFATKGIVSTNEVRQAIGLDPIAGGDVLIEDVPQAQTSFEFGSAQEAPAALPLARRAGPKRTTRARTSATSADLTTAVGRGLGLSSADLRGSSRKRS